MLSREVVLCFHEGGLVSDGNLVHGREAGGSGIGISGVIKAPGFFCYIEDPETVGVIFIL